MIKNMSEVDRKIRLIFGLSIAELLITKEFSSGMINLLGMIAITLMASSYIGTSPIYMLMKVSTVKDQSI